MNDTRQFASKLSGRQLRCLLLVTSLLLLATTPVFGQFHRGSPRDLAADVVSLADGSKIYGIVVQHNEKSGVKVYVERDWMRKNLPALYLKQSEGEVERFKKIRDDLITRLDDWIKERESEPELVDFLQSERDRLQQRKVDGGFDQHKFLAVQLPTGDVKQVQTQSPQQRHIAGVAWKHGLKDVSFRSARSLKMELEKQNVNVAEETFDFSSEIAIDAQSEDQWNARKAIVEFEYLEPLEFYASGSALIKRGEKPNFGMLIGQMMNGQMGMVERVGRELGLPEFNTPTPEPPRPDARELIRRATKRADEDGSRGVRITELKQDLSSPEVTVASVFLVKLGDGRWEPLFKVHGSANVNEHGENQLRDLREDPQIKQALDLVEGMGLGGGNSMIDLALRHGAATQTALAEANDKFFQFHSPYSQRVDWPPVVGIRPEK